MYSALHAHRHLEVEQDDKLHDDIHKGYKTFHALLFTIRCDYSPILLRPVYHSLPSLKPAIPLANALVVNYQIPTPFEIKPDGVVIVNDSAPDDIGTRASQHPRGRLFRGKHFCVRFLLGAIRSKHGLSLVNSDSTAFNDLEVFETRDNFVFNPVLKSQLAFDGQRGYRSTCIKVMPTEYSTPSLMVTVNQLHPLKAITHLDPF